MSAAVHVRLCVRVRKITKKRTKFNYFKEPAVLVCLISLCCSGTWHTRGARVPVVVSVVAAAAGQEQPHRVSLKPWSYTWQVETQ